MGNDMQTLSQYNNDKNKSNDMINKDKIKIIEACKKEIPLHPSSSENYRVSLRQKLFNDNITLYKIKCDYCSTELINPDPGRCLLTNPPQYHICCVGCGWSGYHSL
jgi:hypothetical protein